ncbi:MAG: energy-coupled thiamine transporter ThiT [Clostridia bacterium]|nr:energy-coupled thiamine transporter ThiT [Clostridia bacterium]
MKETKTNRKQTTERLVLSAIFIALSSVLSMLQPFALPQGGGITILSMLPLIVLAHRYGILWGLGSSFIYSLIQLLLGFSTVSAFFLPGDNQQLWWKAILICLMDYVLAYSCMCLGGLFRKRSTPSVSLTLGSIVALSCRYLVHILSGAIFFGSWAEWWFTDIMSGDFGASVLETYSGFGLALFYSVIYNGLYMIPEIILTAIGAFIIGKIPFIVGKTDL